MFLADSTVVLNKVVLEKVPPLFRLSPKQTGDTELEAHRGLFEEILKQTGY